MNKKASNQQVKKMSSAIYSALAISTFLISLSSQPTQAFSLIGGLNIGLNGGGGGMGSGFGIGGGYNTGFNLGGQMGYQMPCNCSLSNNMSMYNPYLQQQYMAYQQQMMYQMSVQNQMAQYQAYIAQLNMMNGGANMMYPQQSPFNINAQLYANPMLSAQMNPAVNGINGQFNFNPSLNFTAGLNNNPYNVAYNNPYANAYMNPYMMANNPQQFMLNNQMLNPYSNGCFNSCCPGVGNQWNGTNGGFNVGLGYNAQAATLPVNAGVNGGAGFGGQINLGVNAGHNSAAPTQFNLAGTGGLSN